MAILDSKLLALQEIDKAAKQLEDILVSQFQKKLEGTLEENEIEELDFDQIGTLFGKLKDLQVDAYNKTSASKQATSDAKEHMNEKQVDLQDVMYEKRHILEEIVQCKKFRSVYQDVELIPIEEFKSKAPPEYLEQLENPHQLFINRLKYELVVRAELKEQQEALQLKRTQLIKENRKIQKKVDQFDKLLDDFVQSAQPLEEALDSESKQPETMEVVGDENVVESMDTTS